MPKNSHRLSAGRSLCAMPDRLRRVGVLRAMRAGSRRRLRREARDPPAPRSRRRDRSAPSSEGSADNDRERKASHHCEAFLVYSGPNVSRRARTSPRTPPASDFRVAGAAVHGAVAARQERHLGHHAALGAGGRMHLARRPAAEAGEYTVAHVAFFGLSARRLAGERHDGQRTGSFWSPCWRKTPARRR